MAANETCTLNEARALLGVSEKTMRNYCKLNKIPFFKQRNIRGVSEYRFRREDLLFFVEQRSAGKHTGIHSASLPLKDNEDNSLILQEKIAIPGKSPEKEKKKDGKEMETSSGDSTSVITACLQDKDYQTALLTQLKLENGFLKELLMEKEKQLASKDSQIERCVEKISSLSETLAVITRESLTKEFS